LYYLKQSVWKLSTFFYSLSGKYSTDRISVGGITKALLYIVLASFAILLYSCRLLLVSKVNVNKGYLKISASQKFAVLLFR